MNPSPETQQEKSESVTLIDGTSFVRTPMLGFLQIVESGKVIHSQPGGIADVLFRTLSAQEERIKELEGRVAEIQWSDGPSKPGMSTGEFCRFLDSLDANQTETPHE